MTSTKTAARDSWVGSHYSPRQVARVNPEAEHIARKSRGTMDKFLNVDQNLKTKYLSARPVPRCPGSEAQQMRQRCEGSMNDFIGKFSKHQSMAPERSVHPRGVTSEASDVAQAHKGRQMQQLVNNYGNLAQSARPAARVKPEAEEIAAGHKGQNMANLFTKYGNMGGATPKAPKIGYGGAEIADKHKGAGAARLLRQERSARSARSSASVSSASGGDIWGGRPKSSHEQNYNRRNATTMVTTWQ